jgi:hypothetical protein
MKLNTRWRQFVASGWSAKEAEFISACISACNGMEDPAKEIQALRDRVKELEERFAPFLEGDNYSKTK